MRLSTTLKIIVLLFALTSVISATIPQQEKFKNLKVLPKNISDDALDKLMDEYKTALGVKCSFCHVKDTGIKHMNFAADDKPEKLIARKMITMTAAINKKYFNAGKKGTGTLSVSCMTCHRGKPRPELDSTGLINPH